MAKKTGYFSVFFILMFLSGILHAGGSHLAPMDVPGSKTVSVDEAKTLFDEGAFFLDVRSEKSWKRGRIPKAIHLDLLKGFSENSLHSSIGSKGANIVIYCNGPRCLRSSIASAKAIEWGYKNIYYFRDGFPGWVHADYPVVSVGNIVQVEPKADPLV